MNSKVLLLTTGSGDEIAIEVGGNGTNEAVETTEVEKVTGSKWSAEEIEEAGQKHDVLSPEALDNAVSYGLPFSLFGFATVFSVLAIIMAIIVVFGKIFGAAQPKAEKKPVEKKAEVKKEEPKKHEEVAVQTVAAPATDTNGIVAAIMAAISSYRNANGEVGGFRVVSFKKRK